MNAGPRSIAELDLSPKPGRAYWSCEREWREEFIYFLLVDRFHDGKERRSVLTPARPGSGGRPERLRGFCGGTLRGITRNIDYVQGLGCTALWLSPVFENDAGDGNYHGYAIRNYLRVDPRFGTKDDLCELVEEAHRRDMRVFLDAVANHTGDVFAYADGDPQYFSDDARRHPIAWRDDGHPIPAEMRDPARYHRRGQIRPWAWDSFPETQWGDFFSLKGIDNDETPDGFVSQRIVIDAHRWWIREADIDGYRMDAVKHMGEMAVARFCQETREYAYSLGKRDFFLFGELVAGDDAINRYAGPNTPGKAGDRTIFYGLTSVLDFPLFLTLPSVVKGMAPPRSLVSRYDALRERALSRGELGRYLVTFIDNHDQIGQMVKRRFGADAPDEQVIAGVGYLLCALGTPCVYYGTEQGFSGEGESDHAIRECLFDPDDPARDFLDTDSRIYRGIAAIAKVVRQEPALRFGRMYFRETSPDDGCTFDLPVAHPCTLAFSRLLARHEVLFAYNTSTSERRHDHVVVDAALHPEGSVFECLYGGHADVAVERSPDPASDARFVTLDLAPMQLVVLRRVG